jgi:hypothetical protein
LRSLTLKECQAYISSRLQVAGGDPMLFTPKAVEVIYACSGGIPRVINVICDGALMTAYGLRKTYIDDSLIRQVAEDLQIGGTVFSGEAVSRNTSKTISPMANKVPIQREQDSKPTSQQPPVVKVAESSGTRSGVVPRIVFDELSVILVDAMGPMASIVLKDRAASLGESLDRFPEDKLKALIELVSDEILDPSMRQDFQQLVQERVMPRVD